MAEPSEAEHFEVIMRAAGYAGRLMLETQALNTGDNARLSYELLDQQGTTPVDSIVIITKPYMERRALATFDIQWPDRSTRLTVTSPPIAFSDYFDDQQLFDDVLAIMVGDLQRIVEYPKRGLQSEQTIPSVVMDAYERLIAKGYTRHLLA